jgi:hypothetical protein
MHEVAMKMETKKNNQERVSIFEIIPQPCSIHRQISSILIGQLNQQGESSLAPVLKTARTSYVKVLHELILF